MVTSIKQSALELVCRRKPGAQIRVADVADTCGVSMGSVYQYFRCLESIISAIYEDVVLDSLKARGSEVLRSADCQRLGALLGQLDTLFGRDYFETFYQYQLTPNSCACDVARTFTQKLNGCWIYADSNNPYWRDYLLDGKV